MSESFENPPAEAGHSPFFANMVVFIALLIGYGLQLWNLAAQNDQIRKTDAFLDAQKPKVREIGAILQGVSHDLVGLSSNSPAAKQIVTEFGIRLQQPRGE